MLIWSVLSALSAISLVVVVSLAMKRRGRRDNEPDGATGGHTGAVLSALFLLVFAIAVIVPWTVADQARQNTSAEAQSLTEAYWASAALPPVQRDQVRTEIKGYVGFVIDKEWPVMARGRLDPAGWQKVDSLRVQLDGMEFKQNTDEAAGRDDTLERVREVFAARRQRAADAKAGLPAGILLFTVVLGVAMIVLPFLLGARPKGMVLVALGVTAAMLGVSIYLVFDINHTFAGALRVGPDAFQSAQHEMGRIP